MGLKQKLISIYEHKYKQLMIIPVLLVLLSVAVLSYSYITKGEFVQKGVSLRGGITLTVPVEDSFDIVALKNGLDSQLRGADIVVRQITEFGATKAFIVEAGGVDEEQLVAALQNLGFSLAEGSYTIESMGSALGESFFRQMILAIIIAFIAMGIVVLITFRVVVPSLFVILAIISDILCTLAVVSLLEIKLSTAGVAAFLMMIGYSVDTDILLTTRVLKRKEGTVFERLLGTVRTGVIMSITSLIAALVALFFSQSDVIRQIALIISIGLFFDIINTWVQNAGILRWHLERKEKTAKQNE